MHCPYYHFTQTTQLSRKTNLGYPEYRCRSCKRSFNERTGTPFNFLEVPTDIVFQVVLWRLRYKLSLRDLAEMFLERGFEFTHETVREWEERFAPMLADQVRRKRKGKAGQSWHVDKTYVKVRGKWRYLYRAIDVEGNLIGSMLSETRDMEVAQTFFRRALTAVGEFPERVTTDGHTFLSKSDSRSPRCRGRASSESGAELASKTTGELSSVAIQRLALEHLTQPSDIARHLMK